MSPNVKQLGLRVDAELLKRLERANVKMREENPGAALADTIRILLVRALNDYEKEQKTKR